MDEFKFQEKRLFWEHRANGTIITIKNIDRTKDLGKYGCVVKNRALRLESTTQININNVVGMKTD